MALIGDRLRVDDRIVSSWDSSPLHHDTPSKRFRAFTDANGFEGITFHQLRHTHASLLFANNVDAVAIASRLGHSDPTTPLRNYAHAYRSRDKQSADTMQALLQRAEDAPKE